MEAAATKEAVMDAAVGAGETTAAAVAAAEGAAWLEVVKVVQLREQRELESAEQDMVQWV